MLPTREQATTLLNDALKLNPGPWGKHSLCCAHCAEKIALACKDLDAEKAYILGLLHDIGRRFGVRHLGHVSDGYSYMMSLNFDEVARVCLSHSFNNKNVSEYIGEIDVSENELRLINEELERMEYDDYDRLIQLCDCLAGSDGVLDLEERMADVERRYGWYNENKRNSNLNLYRLFEQKTGKNLYELCQKDSFKPKIKNTKP